MNARREVGDFLAAQDLESPELTVQHLAEQLRVAHNENDQLSSRLGVVETELQAATKELKLLRNLIGYEVADHNPIDYVDEGEPDRFCSHCGLAWPCPTMNRFGGES